MKRHIPNFITTLNLVSGFIAIVFTINGNLLAATWFIVAAMIFDFLDGLSARVLGAYSDIGKELDSLADLVSFGVAPALMIYYLLGNSLGLMSPFLFTTDKTIKIIILFSPVVMPVCAALRLAIFNLDETQATSFKGLPTPANAIAVISVVFAAKYSYSPLLSSFINSPFALIIFTLVLSLLMVSRLPLLSLKTSHYKFKGNEGRYLLILIILITIILMGPDAAPLIIPLYIAVSLLSMLFSHKT